MTTREFPSLFNSTIKSMPFENVISFIDVADVFPCSGTTSSKIRGEVFCKISFFILRYKYFSS